MTYRIIVCDDDKNVLIQIENLIYNFNKTVENTVQLFTFYSPQEMMHSVFPGNAYNIYLLDIVMPELDGIAVGKLIREQDSLCTIIYMTSSTEYIIDSFLVHPLDYILKPLTQETLFNVLNKALSNIEFESSQNFIVKCRYETVALPFHKIACIEYKNHQIHVTMVDNKVYTSTQSKQSFFAWMEPLLKQRRFLKPHVSFVVNMNAIHAIRNDKTFLLTNGCIVPISTNLYTNVKKTYFSYLSDMYENSTIT